MALSDSHGPTSGPTNTVRGASSVCARQVHGAGSPGRGERGAAGAGGAHVDAMPQTMGGQLLPLELIDRCVGTLSPPAPPVPTARNSADPCTDAVRTRHGRLRAGRTPAAYLVPRVCAAGRRPPAVVPDRRRAPTAHMDISWRELSRERGSGSGKGRPTLDACARPSRDP